MTAPVKAPSLLADPANVALLRDLYAHARHVNAAHATYSMGDGRGGAHPPEHTWTADSQRVSVEGWVLTYYQNRSVVLEAEVDSVRQAVDMLVALGVLPVHFSSAYAAGWNHRANLTPGSIDDFLDGSFR